MSNYINYRGATDLLKSLTTANNIPYTQWMQNTCYFALLLSFISFRTTTFLNILSFYPSFFLGCFRCYPVMCMHLSSGYKIIFLYPLKKKKQILVYQEVISWPGLSLRSQGCYCYSQCLWASRVQCADWHLMRPHCVVRTKPAVCHRLDWNLEMGRRLKPLFDFRARKLSDHFLLSSFDISLRKSIYTKKGYVFIP